jgi:hypothetical protein
MHFTGLHCTALRCTALHCTALHCTALHCTAPLILPRCSPAASLSGVSRGSGAEGRGPTLHCTALHCTALHCTALHFKTIYLGISTECQEISDSRPPLAHQALRPQDGTYYTEPCEVYTRPVSCRQPAVCKWTELWQLFLEGRRSIISPLSGINGQLIPPIGSSQERPHANSSLGFK